MKKLKIPQNFPRTALNLDPVTRSGVLLFVVNTCDLKIKILDNRLNVSDSNEKFHLKSFIMQEEHNVPYYLMGLQYF